MASIDIDIDKEISDRESRIGELQRELELLRGVQKMVTSRADVPKTVERARRQKTTPSITKAVPRHAVSANWAKKLPTVFSAGSPMSAQDIVNGLQKAGEKVQYATVYAWLKRAARRGDAVHKGRKFSLKGTTLTT